MVETCHLQPPVSGPQSDPLLFGVAEALARLFPIEDVRPSVRVEQPESVADEDVDEALAA